jgi:hypothetical protein
MIKLEYTPLETIKCKKPVNRLLFLRKTVSNKTVLDLGALDETAYKTKINTKYWPHKVMSETADKVIGIDSSELLDSAEIHGGGGGICLFPTV